ncbi:MAG TPA: amidohydrolase family protein [Pseudomonadota bacterium]|nr:amidohydrolase family protein [Pseudomonadota bacterium]
MQRPSTRLFRYASLSLLLFLPVCDRNVTLAEEEPPPPPATCSALPTPSDGQRCTVTGPANGSKAVLLAGTLLLPNSVSQNGQVLVDGTGKIACVGCDCSTHTEAADAAKISCPDGVISPGLINTHDHITYTKAAPGTHATNRYNHRHEWRMGVSGDPKRPKISVPGGNNTSAVQWGELRQLLGGTTSLVGSGSGKGVLRNLDTNSQEGLTEKPVDFDTFPLGDSGGERLASGCGYPSIAKASALAALDAYEPHISEGISDEARNEFVCTSTTHLGGEKLVEDKTAIIHAIGLTVYDAWLTATRGAAVIWSPRSNISLYGHTAQVPMLAKMGVPIALGTDWTASGSINVLRELACAADLSDKYFDKAFSMRDLWQMVTYNAALATATDDVLGQIAVGKVGDLSLFFGKPDRQEYAAVVRAGVEDVGLVLRGGVPMYGDATVMEKLGADDAGKCEALDVCGVQKRVCAERETGKKLADLETAAIKPIYQLFACGVPTNEPSCVPFRENEFDGQSTTDDPDGDGLKGAADNCPTVFNPIRPMDHGAQPDSDGDGIGDACDACPLDKDHAMCRKPDKNDEDGDGIENSLDNCPSVPNTNQKDSDGDLVGDVCDACPAFSNPAGAACEFSVKELRDPARGMRPPAGTKVTIKNLLITAVRNIKSMGFHARDTGTDLPYSGVLVYLGGTTAPKATDGTLLQVGHIVTVSGNFTVFSEQDEIDRVSSIVITGTDAAAAEVKVTVKTRDLQGGTQSSAERYENLLCKVSTVTTRAALTSDDDFWVTDEAAEPCTGTNPACTRVGDFLLDGDKTDGSPKYAAGTALSEVSGIVSGYANQYTLMPRAMTDIK